MLGSDTIFGLDWVTGMSRLSWLEKEAETWVEKGIITREQADRITALYSRDGRNRLVAALLILGAALLGAGVILFFASNWQYIHKWAKVAIVFCALLSFHLSSHLAEKSRPRLGAALALLGCLMYGSGIWLVAQIFHISSHFPNGILLWLIGTLPAAFLLRQRIILALSALLLGGWVAAEHTYSPLILGSGAVLYAAVFHLTYALRCPFSLAASLAGANAFIAIQTLMLYNIASGAKAYFLAPAIILPVSLLTALLAGHPANKERYFFSAVFSSVGVIGAGASLYAMSFEYFAGGLSRLHDQGHAAWPLAVLCLVPALSGFYLAARQDGGLSRAGKDSLAWLAGLALAPAVLIIPAGETGLMVFLNLFMFAWALAVMYLGYRKQSGLHFTAGIMFFTFYTITEYFNLFWRMLPKSLFFIAGGAVLMAGGALLERRRRKLVNSWAEAKGGEWR